MKLIKKKNVYYFAFLVLLRITLLVNAFSLLNIHKSHCHLENHWRLILYCYSVGLRVHLFSISGKIKIFAKLGTSRISMVSLWLLRVISLMACHVIWLSLKTWIHSRVRWSLILSGFQILGIDFWFLFYMLLWLF